MQQTDEPASSMPMVEDLTSEGAYLLKYSVSKRPTFGEARRWCLRNGIRLRQRGLVEQRGSLYRVLEFRSSEHRLSFIMVFDIGG